MLDIRDLDTKNNTYKLSGKYTLKSKIGNGSFGQIYKAINEETQKYVAAKLEKRVPKGVLTLSREIKILSDLKDANGFPELLNYGKQDQFGYVIMSLLGTNLEKLFKICGRKFSLKTVLMIMDQMLSRIETLHGKNYLHRDIKPENFCIGLGSNAKNIYLIDFGLAKSYKNSNGKHINYKENRGLIGTARYASLNAHLGVEQSRRDDLESIGYTIIYLLKGTLPWQNLKGYNKQEKYQKIIDLKMKTPIEILCKDLPILFVEYLNYVKSLGFTDQPNYSYMRKLVRQYYIKSGFDYDFQYDWVKFFKKTCNGNLANNKVILDLKHGGDAELNEHPPTRSKNKNETILKQTPRGEENNLIAPVAGFRNPFRNEFKTIVKPNSEKIDPVFSSVVFGSKNGCIPDIKISKLDAEKLGNNRLIDIEDKFEPHHLHPKCSHLNSITFEENKRPINGNGNGNGSTKNYIQTSEDSSSSQRVKLSKLDTKYIDSHNLDSKTYLDSKNIIDSKINLDDFEGTIPLEFEENTNNLADKSKSLKDPKLLFELKLRYAKFTQKASLKRNTLKRISSSIVTTSPIQPFFNIKDGLNRKVRSKSDTEEENINEEDILEWNNGITIEDMMESKIMKIHIKRRISKKQ